MNYLAILLIALFSTLFSATAAQESFKPETRWRGFNLLGMFVKEWSPGTFAEKDFEIIAELGFNFARLPLDYRFWVADNDWNTIDETKLQALDAAVGWGRKHKVHVMLCFHRAPGYTVAKPSEQLNLFEDSEALRVCCKHWAFMARRYKNTPSCELSFNLFNEPPDVAPEVYARVGEALVAAIRQEDATRFIVADGLKWGQKPVGEFYKLGIGQATRGYLPMSISHYQASWVNLPDVEPVWPLSGSAYSPLYGPAKTPWNVPLVISNLPPCRITLQPNMVSGACTWCLTADGKTVLEERIEPQVEDKAGWTNVVYKAEWKISQGRYLKQLTAELPEGARELSIALTHGDWAGVRHLTLCDINGREAVLNFMDAWGSTNNPFTFRGFAAGHPFFMPHEGFESGAEYLQRMTIAPWQETRRAGVFVMVGEFGVHNRTPHQIVLAWMEDNLRLWKSENWGWALWNLHGSFGILDSGRKDVDYVEYRGCKLDRKMLNLLQRY